MAGLFLKMDLDLAESEPVVILADITGYEVELVIGKLFRFWRWVERHCGASRGVTRMSRLVTLARVTSCDEVFLEALIDVGWLALVDGVYVIPNWEKRFSHTAKEKDSSAERQRRCREKKRAESCHGSVTPKRDKSSRPNVTEALPELEEELEVDREKELIPPKSPKGDRVRFVPPSADEVRGYCETHGYELNVDAWFAFYESNGWRVGRNPMKSWQGAVRTWVSNGYGSQPKQSSFAGIPQLPE